MTDNPTEELLTSEMSNGDMSKANTFLDMNDLDNDHIRALIHHYLSVNLVMSAKKPCKAWKMKAQLVTITILTDKYQYLK